MSRPFPQTGPGGQRRFGELIIGRSLVRVQAGPYRPACLGRFGLGRWVRLAGCAGLATPCYPPCYPRGEQGILCSDIYNCPRRVLRILGIPLADDDTRWLIRALYRDAHVPAVSAALMPEKGIDRELYTVALTSAERTAMLGVLDDPPDGLTELRGVLMRDHGGTPPICDDSPLWEPTEDQLP